MLLDRIDIESHGPLNRVLIGPFSQALSAVVAASGSGKTALIRFLRDSLTGTTPTRDGLAQSIGRIVWSAADGRYHCRREPDGTNQGRRLVEFESRLYDANFAGQSRYGRESIVVDLPACVVDGIVTDTAIIEVGRCVQAAIASGLDNSVSSADSSRDGEVRALRSEIADLERQIHSQSLHAQLAANTATGSQTYGFTGDVKRLRDRRAELALEISAIDARRDWAAKSDAELDRRRHKRDIFAAVADEVERLRRQEADLRLRLAEIQSSITKMDEEDARSQTRNEIARAYGDRLEQVNEHLGRVCRVVREIRALGDHWFGGRGLTAQSGWLDQAIDGVTRREAGYAVDSQHYLSSDDESIGGFEVVDRGWSANLAAEIRGDGSSTTGDIQRRLDAVCRLVDNLVGRCEEDQLSGSQPQLGDANPASRLGDWDEWTEVQSTRFEPTRNLDRAEQLLQQERLMRVQSVGTPHEHSGWIAATLNGVSQRLRGLSGQRATYGASNIDPLFDPRNHRDIVNQLYPANGQLDAQSQIAAVRRCERELVGVLRNLTTRRELMLRRIAEAQSLPLVELQAASIDAEQQHDDPQLYQRLVHDRIAANESNAKHRAATRTRLAQQQADLAANIKQTTDRITERLAEAETIRVYLRTLPVVNRYDDDLRLRERLVAEVREIDRQLAQPRIEPVIVQRHAHCIARLRSLLANHILLSGLAAAASEYVRRLSSDRMKVISWFRGGNSSATMSVEIDGRAEASYGPVNRFIAALAVRLAASDELARRGRPLPLIIETPSPRMIACSGAASDLRPMLQSALEVLADSARLGRQIVVLTDDAVIADSISRIGGSVHSLRGGYHGSAATTVSDSYTSASQPERMLDINREFDVAWQDAATDQNVWRREDVREVVAAPSDTESNRRVPDTYRESVSNGRVEATDRPFFLAGHSLVEQAPSIDATTAARLRAIGVERIDHLLAASPKELSSSLGIADVDAATIRRWQHECRLVCGVRKLRPFDARVLVGCGITHPRELAETDPVALAERVETFLATDRGSRFFQSATSQERTRLSDWINQSRSRGKAHTSRSNSTHGERNSSQRFVQASAERQPPVRAEHQQATVVQRESTAWTTSTREPREAREPRESQSRRTEQRSENRSDSSLKFYLQRSSDVEAGPSIGPRMAERLHRIGVKTVDDLVNRSAASIADALKLAKVDADLVRQWQQQAVLVCRVPMLRGHDAQLLVAAGITEPQRLAECEANWLLSQVEPIASSREGKAILRGGKHPDLAEMQEWIGNAKQHRELVAA